MADLKCKEKTPSVRDRLTLDVINVIAMQSVTKLVGKIGSKSNDLHGAH